MRLIHMRSILSGFLLLVLLAACGAPAAQTSPAPTADTMAGMDHGATPAEGQPYDAAFIDGMIVHHEGAIIMANQALEQAERQEIKELANEIISAQEGEIAQMKEWRAGWHSDLGETSGMAMEMGPMEVPAGDGPFDQRFIQAMILHHEGAIAMAQDALQNAERQEIKDLAQAVISAQEAEIAQMRQWLSEWYGIEQ
jgi:uncharacterized protein (DUF305 family)